MPLRCSLLDILASLTGTIFSARDGKGEEERISTDDILGATLNIPAERQTDAIAKRLSYVMEALGWQGPEHMRMGNVRKRGYWRKVSA